MVLVFVTSLAKKLHIAFGSVATHQVLLLPYYLLQQARVVLLKDA